MKVQQLDPKTLTPYANNAKIHTTEQIDKIAGQISAFGFDQPIVVDKEFVIIKGHGRREAALRLGLKQVPVVVAEHLDEYQTKAARIADNKVAEADYDEDKLKFDLGTLQHHDFNLKLTGFDLGEIDKLLEDSDVTSTDEDEDEEAEKKEDELEAEAVTQYIVSVHCANEEEMSKLYEELNGRGMDCKLLT